MSINTPFGARVVVIKGLDWMDNADVLMSLSMLDSADMREASVVLSKDNVRNLIAELERLIDG